MDLFEVILLLIRASREQSWELHLQSLNLLCSYFFAFDMLNYACMTAVYLAQMNELKEKDENICALLDAGGFPVNKYVIPLQLLKAIMALISGKPCIEGYWWNQGYSEFRNHP